MAHLDVFSASAGSGKTYTLARRVIDILVRNPADYAHILAVTFTNKATGEMKERIVGDLNLMVCGDADNAKRKQLIDYHMKSNGIDEPTLVDRCKVSLRNILYDYSHFSVSTIDHFVQRLIRSFAYEQGLTSNYAVSIDSDEVIEAAWTDMIESLTQQPELSKHLVHMAEERLAEGKSWVVAEDIKKMGKSLLSDKREFFNIETLTLAHFKALDSELTSRERDMLRQAYEIAIKFKNKVQSSGVTGLDKRTFPDKFFEAIPQQIPIIKDNQQRIAKETRDFATSIIEKFANLKDSFLNKTAKGPIDELRAFADGIREEAKTLSLNYFTTRAVKANVSTMAVMSSFARNVATVEERENKRSISSSGSILRDLIDDCPVPFIYEKSGNRFDTIMIDEFQDTSRVQYENFAPLLRNSLAEGHDCLVVGDVKQSIYRFREGDWRLLGQRVEAEFDESRHCPLSDNFRSRREIVMFNNAVFNALPTLLDSALPEPENPADTMAAMYSESRQTPQKPEGGYAMMRVVSIPNDKTNKNAAKEYVERQLIDAIKLYHDEKKYPYSDICVLVRMNKDGANVVARLSAEGIPVMSADSLFVMKSNATQGMADAMRYISTGEVTPLFAAVKAFTGEDDVALLARDWDALSAQWGERFEALRGLGLVEMAGELVNMMSETMRNEQMPYIDAFMQKMRDSIADGAANLDDFLRLVAGNADRWPLDASSGDDAVRVITIHKAKGLEFKVVLIPYAELDLSKSHDDMLWASTDKLGLTDEAWRGCSLPIKCAKELPKSAFAPEYAAEKRAKVEDELNAFYVALTRPTDALMVWAVNTVMKSSDSVGNMGRYLCSFIDDAVLPDGFVKEEEVLSGEPAEGDEPQLTARVQTLSLGAPPQCTSPSEAPPPSMSVSMAHSFRPSASPSINTQVEMGEYERREDMVSYGLTMHGILESVNTVSDLHDAISAAVTDGLVLPADAQKLETEMSTRMTDPRVAQWFDGSMPDVWAETTMIGPARRLRPDRIMRSASGETVIVDYKFGRAERREHVEQVQQYMSWLAEAGFSSIRAFLWYYTIDKIVEVK